METGPEERLGAPRDNHPKPSGMWLFDLTLLITILVASLLMIAWVVNVNSANAYVYCDLQLHLDVNEHVFYANDKLIIKGNVAHGVDLQGLLIPLDGKTPGKRIDIPVKGSYFEYVLHQFGPDDKEMDHAVIVNAVKEMHDGTCLVGDYEIIQYKGMKE
ncbi:MAG: hypothetical protein HMLIMOIP_002457 [Candidatus Nitrosomirales archaeon]|jgi:hypothetical protein